MIICRNLNIPSNTIYSFFREPNNDWRKPGWKLLPYQNIIDSFQIFEEDERDFLPRKRKSEEEEELEKELANEKKRKKKKKKKKKDEDGNDDDSDENNEADDEQLELERRLEEVKKEEQRKRDEERREKNEKIDNPYLKPVRMPRCGLGGIPLITTPLKKEKWIIEKKTFIGNTKFFFFFF